MYRAFVLLLSAPLLAAVSSAAPEYAQMGPDIYDVRADGDALIANALRQAQIQHKRVLLDLGANWCIWCRRNLEEGGGHSPAKIVAFLNRWAVHE